MNKRKNLMDAQLKETSQLTGACWSIWLEHTTDWEILAAYRLNVQNRSTILRYLQQKAGNGWLSGALAGRRSRPRVYFAFDRAARLKIIYFS